MQTVKKPTHYQGQGMQVLDVTDAFDCNFNIGNVVKYVLRADKKRNHVEDLLKAREYLAHEISRISDEHTLLEGILSELNVELAREPSAELSAVREIVAQIVHTRKQQMRKKELDGLKGMAARHNHG
tara:strand:- start:1031 stop:1411 length:381 start_codon:yes stop_codon:yes gene_type:complete